MRKLSLFVEKYGPVAGPKLYHALQSQAAHAGVSARLRRKIEAIQTRPLRPLPLFDRPDQTKPADASITTSDALPSTPLAS